MAEPYLSEIRIMGFSFAPKGWAQCDGQLLPINQYQALFSLLGTTYGGNGTTTFALPDLRGRVPIHFDGAHRQGLQGGEAAHTLTAAEMPAHMHGAMASGADGDTVIPGGSLFGAIAGQYSGAATPVALVKGTIGNQGGSQGHNNMQPYQALLFAIALQGVFPSRS